MTRPLVFLIDDDEDVRDALALLLRTMGLAVEAYENAASFLAREAPERFGCVVTDVRMAGMSGLHLLERLQADASGLPVVVITGHGDVAACRRALRGGAVDFLTKPIDEHALLEAIDAGLARGQGDLGKARERDEAARALSVLSQREREIITLIAQGLATKEIARALELSPRTVEKHRAGIATKLGTTSVADMVRLVLATA
jgi:FixJ family two-component response regulator